MSLLVHHTKGVLHLPSSSSSSSSPELNKTWLMARMAALYRGSEPDENLQMFRWCAEDAIGSSLGKPNVADPLSTT